MAKQKAAYKKMGMLIYSIHPCIPLPILLAVCYSARRICYKMPFKLLVGVAPLNALTVVVMLKVILRQHRTSYARLPAAVW